MEEPRNNGANKITTTIAIWKSTKEKLDRNKAPGQCYNGFVCQLIDLWEGAEKERMSTRAGSAEENQGARGPAILY